MVNDPRILNNDYILEFDHPSLGKLKDVGIPVEYSDTLGSIKEPVSQQESTPEGCSLVSLTFPRGNWKGPKPGIFVVEPLVP